MFLTPWNFFFSINSPCVGLLCLFLQLNQGNRTNFNRIKETEDAETAPNSEIDSSVSSSFPPNNYQMPSQTTDTTSMNSAQASEYEDAESGALCLCYISVIV